MTNQKDDTLVINPSDTKNPSYLDGVTAKVGPANYLKLKKSAVSACKPNYIVQGCDCEIGLTKYGNKKGRNLLPSVCMSLTCTACEPWVGRRRKLSLFYRFVPDYNSGIKDVLYTVFTIPLEIRNQFLDKKIWQKLRKKLWHLLKKKYGGRYGVECSHPVGDSSDEFHPHFNFLWRQRNGQKPYLDLDTLKQDFKDFLGIKTVVDVWHGYSNKYDVVMKWCKYVSRVFLGYHWWIGFVRWYGKYPKNPKYEACHCEVCGSKFKTIGIMSADEVERYYEYGWKMGIDPPWYDDSKIRKFKKRKSGKG